MNPIIIYSDKFLNTISLGGRVNGISLFPFIILREFKGEPISFKKKLALNEKLIRHETIHFKQAIEMLVIPFYVWYVTEWALKSIFGDNGINTAYRRLSFEREAYLHELDSVYLLTRKPYAWFKLINK